jgi:RNA 2',3'-cyclic 3'-phosphodiesterase
VRVFLAAPGDPAWIESASRLTRDLQSRLPKASWTRPESWHLTVRFLGEISEDAVSRFAERLAPAASRLHAGELLPAGPALFPSLSRWRTVGVAFDPQASDALFGAIARASETAAREIGCAPEPRPFRPHVTFARVRSPWPRQAAEEATSAIREWPFPPWHMESLVLYRSRLDPAGAVHAPLREWRAAAEVRA